MSAEYDIMGQILAMIAALYLLLKGWRIAAETPVKHAALSCAGVVAESRC